MKFLSVVGILLFLLVTVGSASADVVLTRANGAYPGSLQIDVTYDASGNGTINYLDLSTGINNPGITGVGYNLDVDAQQIIGYKKNSNMEQILYTKNSQKQIENRWMQKNNFGTQGELGTFLRFYGGDQGDSDGFYKIVVRFSSFNGKVPGNEKGNQVGVNFVCDEFNCFLAGPGNSGTIDEKPALSLEKTALSAKYNTVGQIISYNYVVKNIGNVPITGLTITDDKLGTVTKSSATLEPGNSVTVSAYYTITQVDLNAGSLTNLAYATSTYKGNQIKSNTDSVTLIVDTSAANLVSSTPQTTYSTTYNNKQVISNDATGAGTIAKPSLTIEKSATPTNYSRVGQIIAYTYVVKNTGNVPISGLTVMDDKLGTVSKSSSTLEPGNVVTVSATHIINPVDLSAGTLTNSAYATGRCNDNEIKSNIDSITIKADTQIPEFPSVILPLAAILGLLFITQRKRQ
jgi:hypothetical protein